LSTEQNTTKFCICGICHCDLLIVEELTMATSLFYSQLQNWAPKITRTIECVGIKTLKKNWRKLIDVNYNIASLLLREGDRKIMSYNPVTSQQQPFIYTDNSTNETL